MCQWKFLVLTYRANTSARKAFIAAEMSLVAALVRSVRVDTGASRRCLRSLVFSAVRVVMAFSPLEFDWAPFRPARARLSVRRWDGIPDPTPFAGKLKVTAASQKVGVVRGAVMPLQGGAALSLRSEPPLLITSCTCPDSVRDR